MKKLLLLSVSLLLIVSMVFGFSSCKKKKKDDAKSYTLDTTAFNSTAVFEENLSLDGLKLVESNGDVVNVTPDMVSPIDTASVGDKNFTVSYNDQDFTVDYKVRFRITHVINGVETSQLVMSAEEITVPETPKISGKQFDCWSVQIPNVLTSNLRIDALYKTLTSEREDVYTWSGEGLLNLEGYAESGAAITVTVTDKDGNTLPASLASVDTAANKIRYNLGTYDNIVIAIDGDVDVPKSWNITRTEKPTLTIGDGSEAVGLILGGKPGQLKINSTSSTVKLNYNTSFDNANVNAGASGGFLFVNPVQAGVSKLVINAVNTTNELEYITLTQYVVIAPETFLISNDRTEYGIEDIWTIGGVNTEGLTKLNAYGLNAGAGFYENITFVSSDERVGVSKDGIISVHSASSTPGMVELRAVFSYKGIEFESAPMQVRCVFDGVNVYNYNQLWEETNSTNPRPVVLQSNVRDFSVSNYTTMKSTYDTTYYSNIGQDATIKVLMQFKNNVYGNGYEINAHNATLGSLDSTGKPTLFKGPLNFVATGTGDSSAISVKGQDNIVFAVYDNVTLNNVVLKSCDDQNDLANLDYAGTTVEVLGDNVTIEYSRLMNGRTVLRVFGDDEDATKPIHLTVSNTLIKAAREFLARIGSNRFYQTDEASPKLPEDTGSDYNAKKNYNNANFDKASYDSKYINTFVTFKNTVFEDAGIFAIGLDAHFAGEYLKDGRVTQWNSLIGNWYNLAKTSYGAKVTLDTDVRFYNWKPLEDIDSSTLIENHMPGDSALSELKFDVKSLVAKYANKGMVLYDYNGKSYVHAGIAFFGGGKNYSAVENAITSEFNHQLNTLTISLDEVGQGFLENAAGTEPFYFMLYGSNSTFTYKTQLELENKYSCLYSK